MLTLQEVIIIILSNPSIQRKYVEYLVCIQHYRVFVKETRAIEVGMPRPWETSSSNFKTSLGKHKASLWPRKANLAHPWDVQLPCFKSGTRQHGIYYWPLGNHLKVLWEISWVRQMKILHGFLSVATPHGSGSRKKKSQFQSAEEYWLTGYTIYTSHHIK